jgi:hypothetical protein
MAAAPPLIKDSTDLYFIALSNRLEKVLREKCLWDPKLVARHRDLLNLFQTESVASDHELCISSKQFSILMAHLVEKLGLRRTRHGSGIVYAGIGLDATNVLHHTRPQNTNAEKHKKKKKKEYYQQNCDSIRLKSKARRHFNVLLQKSLSEDTLYQLAKQQRLVCYCWSETDPCSLDEKRSLNESLKAIDEWRQQAEQLQTDRRAERLRNAPAGDPYYELLAQEPIPLHRYRSSQLDPSPCDLYILRKAVENIQWPY